MAFFSGCVSLVSDPVSTSVSPVGYENMDGQKGNYTGEVAVDWYGKRTPKHAHGTENIGKFTSSGKLIIDAALKIYDRTVNKDLLIRRIYLVVNHVTGEEKANETVYEQLDLFTDYAAKEKEEAKRKKERALQEAMLTIKGKYGKNAVLKGVNFEEGATGRERNNQVGGHKA